MSIKEYSLDGLNCANCALKIEKRVAKIDGIEEVLLNFSKQTLRVNVPDGDGHDPLSKITKLVTDLEPDVKVYEILKNRVQEPKERNFEKRAIIKIIRIVIGLSLCLFGVFLLPENIPQYSIFILAYLISGYDVLYRALKNLIKGRMFDENFLMAIATIGAIAIKEYPEAVAVMLFYQIGDYFQEKAVNRSRRSISDLMDIRPVSANVECNGEIVSVLPEDVNIGDILVVKPGEKIPLDGIIIEGRSNLNTSAISGESLPIDVAPGVLALSGSINISGLLKIRVKSSFQDSTVSRILDMVSDAAGRKSRTEKFITSFARVYTPVVVGIAFILAVFVPLLIPGQVFSVCIYRALLFLVISCPCALVVSVPLSVFSGIGLSSRKGILVKGGNYLDVLANVKTVVFDKTGTLTEGKFIVSDIKPSKGINKEDFVSVIASLENNSNHPVAMAIVEEAAGSKLMDISDFIEIPGLGVTGKIENRTIFAGNEALMKKQNFMISDKAIGGTVVHLSVDEKYWGYLTVSDIIKKNALSAIKALRQLGISKTVLLTGDRKEVADSVNRSLGIDLVYSELLPQNKVEHVERLLLENDKEKLLFVGDGINDAPVLSRADVGVAMGGLGSDAAIEAADVVIMNDNLEKIADGIKIAKRTRRIVQQNIYFSLFVKIGFLILGSLGLVTMWMAVFADVGVTLLAILNSLRVLNFQKNY